MHEVLLYGPIYDETAVNFITAVQEADESTGIRIRINTRGGDVDYTRGMIAKFIEYPGKKSAIIDGAALSGGFFFALHCDEVVCWNTSRALVHRAAYYPYYEENMDDDTRADLVEMNKGLESAFRAKINVKKFEALKGVKVKDIFSLDTRVDVYLTAKEMKAVGLVSKVLKMTPDKRAEIQQHMEPLAAAAFAPIPNITEEFEEEEDTIESQNPKPKKTIKKIMTPEEFHNQHPEAYKAIVVGAQKNERDRVNAWMKFAHIDAAAVAKCIEDGSTLADNQAVMADLIVKMNDPKRVQTAAAAAPGAVVTDAPLVEGAPTELEAANKAVLEMVVPAAPVAAPVVAATT